MLIDCPGCGKSYHIIKAVLAPYGRRVACPRCDSIWFVSQDGYCAPEVPDDLLEDDLLGTGADIELDAAEGAEPLPSDDVARPPLPLERPPQPRGPHWIRRSCALLALSMALIGFRSQIVQLWPRAATAYIAMGLPVNLRGLALENFHTVAVNDGSRTILGIEGDITNLRAETTKIPVIRLAIRDAQGRTLYSWNVKAQQPKLTANQTLVFRTRLAAPPAEGTEVLVDFVPAPQKTLATAWRHVWHF